MSGFSTVEAPSFLETTLTFTHSAQEEEGEAALMVIGREQIRRRLGPAAGGLTSAVDFPWIPGIPEVGYPSG